MLVLCISFLAAGTPTFAQFVGIEAVIDVTTWHHQEETGLALKKVRTFEVHCVVGTNTWYIENHSQTNPVEKLWFIDRKVIRQQAYADGPAPEDTFYSGRRGLRSANITASDDGYPGGEMFVTLPWFAFCSGSYFKRPSRSVPLPAAIANHSSFGFDDKTEVFADALGLPRRVDLLTGKGQLKCEYHVQQSTNVLGWNYPTAFTVVQNEPGEFDQLRRQLTANGRVTRIRPARKPELPEDIQARLEMLERYPSRRR